MQQVSMAGGQQAGQTEDWTKFVTLNPPNEVKFKICEEDPSKSLSEYDKTRALSKIQIINKSQSAILFKVKTTNIKNYMVRPNSEVIPSGHSITVKILTQQNITAATKNLTHDRFLVQLTKIETPTPAKQRSVEEISKLWDGIDKSKLVQYKMKVDLSPEILEAIATLAKQDPGAPGAGPDAKGELYQTVTTAVVDQMLDHRTGKPEESKEKPDVARYPVKPGSLQGGRYGAPQPYGGMKPRMEDIKEHDSESQQDLAQSQSSKAQNRQGDSPGHAPRPPHAAYPQHADSLSVKTKIAEAQSRKAALQAQLQRIKDQKNIMKNAGGALGSASQNEKHKLYHLLLCAVFGLFMGVYTQIKIDM